MIHAAWVSNGWGFFLTLSAEIRITAGFLD